MGFLSIERQLYRLQYPIFLVISGLRVLDLYDIAQYPLPLVVRAYISMILTHIAGSRLILWHLFLPGPILQHNSIQYGCRAGIYRWSRSLDYICLQYLRHDCFYDMWLQQRFVRKTYLHHFGNVLMIIGAILGGTSHSVRQSIAAHSFLGFGGGNCQIAAFALPELLPNKWRHIGVVIADAGIYFDVIVGPVVARIAYKHVAVCTYPPFLLHSC